VKVANSLLRRSPQQLPLLGGTTSQDVKFKAYQASFIVSQSKHNVQVLIVGDNRESLTTTTSSALGLRFNVDVAQEDVKLKAFQASYLYRLSVQAQRACGDGRC
jgi:hypothetical protein